MTVLIHHRDLVRLIGLAQVRLGVEPGAQNRTVLFSTRDLIERIWSASGAERIMRSVLRGRDPVNPLSPEVSSALAQMAGSATPAELSDVGLIDAFFGGKPGGTSNYRSTIQEVICGGHAVHGGGLFWTVPSKLWDTARAIASIPFYCPVRPAAAQIGTVGTINWIWSVLGYPEGFFGLDLSKPWGELRPIVMNILVLKDAASKFPWPGPVQVEPTYWWEIEQSGLRDLIRLDGILTRDIARVWITLSIIRDYNRLANYAQEALRKKARGEKMNQIVMTVGLTAVGLIIGGALVLALSPAIAAPAGGLFKSGFGYVTDYEKQQAVAGLQDAARQLQSSDPAFAGEVSWTAGYIDRMLQVQTAEQAEAKARSPGGGSDPLSAIVGIGLPAAVSAGISLLSR